MEHLESGRSYVVRQRPSWLPEYRLWHTIVLVLLTGIAGWYGVYRVAAWLLEVFNR